MAWCLLGKVMCVNANKWADPMVSYVIGIHWNVVDICK